jgi:1-acyl-sn-glycerol-3-phosphate acyltransferase
MVQKVNYLWRLIGTGIAFASFSAGGALMTVTAFPLVALLSRSEEKRTERTRHLICLTFRLFVFCLRAWRIIAFSVEGKERLADGKGRLVVANHPTLLDVVLLVSMMPKAQCVVKGELWSNRFLGGVMRAAGYVRNDGDPESTLEQCRAALALGQDIVIFPEGTRSVPGEALRFQRGFANIAALAPCDLQLVTITCHPSTLTKGSRWYDIPPQKPVFTISVGEELEIEPYIRQDPRSKVVRRLTRDLEAYYSGKLAYERS